MAILGGAARRAAAAGDGRVLGPGLGRVLVPGLAMPHPARITAPSMASGVTTRRARTWGLSIDGSSRTRGAPSRAHRLTAAPPRWIGLEFHGALPQRYTAHMSEPRFSSTTAG